MSIKDIIQQVKADLEAEDTTLTCDRFKYQVEVQHQDGSWFLLKNALPKRKRYGNFEILLVWTEHCGSFYFFMDDLEGWKKDTYETLRVKRKTSRAS